MKKTGKVLLTLMALAFLFGSAWNTTYAAGTQTGSLPKPEGAIIQYDKGYRFDRNGWVYVHIEGTPRERGMQHGYLAAPELAEIFQNIKHLTYWETGMTWEYFVEAAQKLFVWHVDEEYMEEIKGIAAGAQKAGVNVTWQDILTWNGYEELTDYWWPNERAGKYATPEREHCSAFIATGRATRDGRIVIGHNSWTVFEQGQFFNLILDIQPDKGHHMFMQSIPGHIDSMTDFFVTDAGIIGTETTIGGFSDYDPGEIPEFLRIRKAMQYAENLDQFVEIMQKSNNGGYANSWLLGDVNTGEIMRFEQGLKYQSIERTKDGFLVGFNAPVDPRIRNLECGYVGYDDIRYPAGARRVRLTQLMKEHSGKLDAATAEKILADHYDVYLKREKPGSRTVDGHYELDARENITIQGRPPFMPMGAVDGKVMDSEMAKKMSFRARFGNSSGMPFNAEKFFAQHPQFDYLKGYLKDRPARPWTLFSAGER